MPDAEARNPLFSQMLGAEGDGKVTVASAQVDGMRDLVVVDRTHTFIMWAPDVLTQTFAFLEHRTVSTLAKVE